MERMSVYWALEITPNQVDNWVVPRVHNHYSFPKIKQLILIYNHVSSIFLFFLEKSNIQPQFSKKFPKKIKYIK
jgi:hypothetical protein